MDRRIVINTIRFFVLILVQVLVFKRIAFNWGDFAFIHFFVYPLFFVLLPIKTPRSLVIILAFLIGIITDLFYDSIGIHASASVFAAYLRNIILKSLEPYEGYNIEDSPTMKQMGFGWFIAYISIILFVHLFFYFSVEAFSFVFIFEITMNTIFSYIASLIIIILSQFIFRSKY